MIVTDGRIRRAGHRRIYREVEGRYRVTTAGTDQGSCVSSGSIEALTIPGIGQLAVANSCVGRAGHSRVNRQN